MYLGVMTYWVKIGDYRLKVIDNINIKKSVETLSDTAIIVIPGTSMNKALEIENLIKEGDAIEISLGYGNDNKIEFKGFLNSISNVGANITIECEDSLYLFRKALKNTSLKNIKVVDLLKHIISEIDPSFSVDCNYDFKYDKFVIQDAEGIDVLKKVQEETKANIYFVDKVLHVHPQYSKITNSESVVFDFAVNIEKSDLKYKTADKRKYQVEVEGVSPNGKRIKTLIGKTGGEKRCIKVFGVTDEAALKKRGEQELQSVVYTGYEGNFTGWLIPYCEPAFKVKVQDRDYPNKNGIYYVIATETKFSKSGGERIVTIGKKVG
jgi:hypothetical protein